MINWLRTQYGRFSDWQRKRKAEALRKAYLDAADAARASVRRAFAQGVWIECEDCDGLGYLPGEHFCTYCHGGGRVFRGL